MKPLTDQSNIRIKRGSRFLLISVIAQQFFFLSEDFVSFLSLLIFDTVFAFHTSTSLSSPDWCRHVYLAYVSVPSVQHLLRTGQQSCSSRHHLMHPISDRALSAVSVFRNSKMKQKNSCHKFPDGMGTILEGSQSAL